MAKESRRSFLLYYDYRQHLAILSDEERGRLLMALLDYGENGTEPDLDGAALMAFSFISGQMDRDAEKYERIVQKRREAGQKGGRPPKSDGQPPEDEPEPEETEQSEESESTDKQTKAKKAKANDENQTEAPPKEKPTDAQTDRFNEFWKQYPKKVGKAAAQKSWKQIKPDAELFERIMRAVETAKKSDQWTREGGRYIPNPTTWLNQGRWDDEPVQNQPPTSFDTDEFFEAALRRSYRGEAPPTPKEPPKTAGDDAEIYARMMKLKEELGGTGT